MGKNRINFAIIVFIIIILIIFIILYKVKKSVPKKISKNGAICLCKYVVYNKIDKTLFNNLKEIICEEKDNITNVILVFFTNPQAQYKKINPSYTRAYCTFNSYYINDKTILLKKFFYKNTKNTIYLYYNTYINIF